jgi:hypothetical protein
MRGSGRSGRVASFNHFQHLLKVAVLLKGTPAIAPSVSHTQHGLVREGLEKIAEKFASPNHVGPQFVADFPEVEEAEERAILQRDAYERVIYLLRDLREPQRLARAALRARDRATWENLRRVEPLHPRLRHYSQNRAKLRAAATSSMKPITALAID